MKHYIVNGLAIVGGGFIVTKATGYFLKRYRKQIKASVIDKVANFFSEDEDQPDEEVEDKKDDPLVAAFAAYLNAKKGAKK